MNDDDLYDLAADICAKAVPSSRIAELLPHVTEGDMLSVDPLGGDCEGTSVLSDKMVNGRKDYRCHMMATPIPVGERHRCLRERTEDGTIETFRFSVPALVLAHFGEDPTALRK